MRDLFDNEFFKIIDDIDNKILNNESIEVIANQYNLNLEIIKDILDRSKENFEIIGNFKNNKR